MSKQLNIGVIGAGRIGRLHTENLLKHPQVNVKAIADLQIDHARAWGNGLGIPLLTQDAEQIISDPGIDAVFICTSTNTHIDMIERSAKAGKHIFCEKPISFDVRGTRLALQAASDSGVKFQLGFNRRFDPNFRRVREIVASGQIGDPHLIKITSRDPSPLRMTISRYPAGCLWTWRFTILTWPGF